MTTMTRWKLAIGAGLTAALLAAFSAGTLFAQTPAPPAAPPTHEEMHRMMDAIHGEGFSERMHAAVPGSEEMMEQCAAMMGMMRQLGGMKGQGGMAGMTGMMGGEAMRDMMGRMNGR